MHKFTYTANNEYIISNVPVMIDGAHAPSQIDIDVQDIGCDWYSGNLHK